MFEDECIWLKGLLLQTIGNFSQLRLGKLFQAIYFGEKIESLLILGLTGWFDNGLEDITLQCPEWNVTEEFMLDLKFSLALPYLDIVMLSVEITPQNKGKLIFPNKITDSYAKT